MTAVDIVSSAAKGKLADRFFSALSSAEKVLNTVTAERAEQSWRSGGWTRKQILGHLCDSAVNNHVRIVKAVLDGHYEGPEYEQERWVSLHGYVQHPWSEILDLWRLENRLLGRVIENAPATALSARVKIGQAEMSLEDWVGDYLAHLQHHIEQIGKDS